MFVMKSYGTLFDQRMHGMFLKSFDPDARDGLGETHWCVNPGDAMQFDTAFDGFQFWKQQSKLRPFRDDGKPNRPLTAHTIEMVKA